MGYKYRAITANCGNDSIGNAASTAIANLLHNENADFCVINCQEVAFYKTQRQLQAAVGDDYTVTLVDKMPTHTKLSTQFDSNTGIATYIIHKKSYDVTFSSSQAVRRNNNRVGGGSGYNKGGLITEFTLKEHGAENVIRLQTMSGHLDSNNVVKRSKDWQNINKSLAKKVDTWDDLVTAYSHLIFSGYDANTRNKLLDDTVVNLWLESPNSPEMQMLYQASLGGQNYSKQSTYKTALEQVSQVPDKKRPGYARGGMLDFVSVADGRISDRDINEDDVVQIGAEKDSKRDHDVVISPLQEYHALADFDVIKSQMVSRLIRVAPNLAGEIATWTDSVDVRTRLLQVHQHVLSPDGLLNNALELHTKKLHAMSQLTISPFLNSSVIKTKLSEILFSNSPWFESLTLANKNEFSEKYHQKQQLMNLLLTSLADCQTEHALEKRLDWYKQLHRNLEIGHYDNDDAIKKFHNWSIQEYQNNCVAYLNSLNNFHPQTPNERIFIKNGKAIHAQITEIAERELAREKPDFKNIGQLNKTLELSKKALDTVKEGGDVIPISKQLAHLSSQVVGKSSPGWQALGVGLFSFAGMALVVMGLLAAVPTGGASVLFTAVGAGVLATTGVGAVGLGIFVHNREKGLSKSVSNYKQALHELTNEEVAKSTDPLLGKKN